MPKIAYTTFGINTLLTGLISHVVAILVAMLSVSGAELFFSIVFPFSCLVLAVGSYAELKNRGYHPSRDWRFYVTAAVTVFPLLGPFIALGLLYSFQKSGQEGLISVFSLFPAIFRLKANALVLFVLIIFLFLLFAVIHSRHDPYFKRPALNGLLPQSVLAADQHENFVKISGQKFVEYVSSGNYFKCSIPADWSVYEPGFGLSAEEKKVYGVTLCGPPNSGPVAPLISLHYYTPGNLLHKTMDIFIRRHSGPVLGFVTKGKSYGEVRQIEIAGRVAKIFERIDIRFIGERTINPPKVSIFEKFIVIPAVKDEGFYVLKLSVPNETKDKYTEIFGKTVKSFLPEK